MDVKNLTEPQINEICKAFVYGRTIEDIASIEHIPIAEVTQLIKNSTEKVQELKAYYKSMGVI